MSIMQTQSFPDIGIGKYYGCVHHFTKLVDDSLRVIKAAAAITLRLWSTGHWLYKCL